MCERKRECVRERARARAQERERERERTRERERERKRERASERERERERDRERERERGFRDDSIHRCRMAHHFLVDMLVSRYKPVNFRAEIAQTYLQRENRSEAHCQANVETVNASF